ncbi:hypothetical protein J437_LFUL007766 [Ladona fulva]|uniref:CD109 antigen n=1 Tax=Ladona fulva TaxID=123851 RepID=A0A8K0K6F8_LADFU|nr:hypothetical protein J437_LFUL007766 [Ladona fulva]
MISAFGVSPSHGFGMLPGPIEYVGVLPFFINVEMPDDCRQGEQVGIRVSVFNYMTSDVEGVVILANSNDYKFVHVEMDGIVRSYNPRLSSGEHQFFFWIAAQDVAVIHVPIVPMRLGDIYVTITASTLLGKDTVTRKLHVEADGLPQYRHQSILLDLSNRAYVFQYLHVNVTETPLITYDEDRYYVYGSNRAFVSVVGDVVGPIFPTMPVNATSLLHLPMDSAEQNMFNFAALYYTTMYMRLINQRNKTLERQSFHHMNIGYQRQLSFMAPDGSFKLFRSDWNQSSSSVWLTAYCARVLQEASFYEWENFIYIDPEIAVSFHDGSPLSHKRLKEGRMEIRPEVVTRSGGRRSLEVLEPPMSADRDGIWEVKIDLRSLMGLDDNTRRSKEAARDVQALRLSAYFKDGEGDRANTEMTAYAHYSPSDRQIKISTSTRNAKVGEYVILHVQSNYYLESFEYIVVSKGAILQSGREGMQATVRTFALTLGPEMAPSSTVIVYHIGRYGHVSADSLTFPVNGISRNNFTVFVNNRKARTGEVVEVAIYGEPGAYVGLSGIDRAFYSMQAGNELTYASVIDKMSNFGEDGNGTFSYKWFSHEGNPDESVYFPSSTYGIDANRTFEYSGLIVFSDIPVPRRPSICNFTTHMECLDGRCYRKENHCDGRKNCEDGTDEAGCSTDSRKELMKFRKYRFNRIQRHYENVWLWKDVNIGPHGRYIFNIDVPIRPAHWMISAFGVSPSHGFGMLPGPIEYVGVLPFFINVEMPDDCRQGEQVGIRVSVFNYMTSDVEGVVILANSNDYKFVHVEMDGIVRSYNPRLSSGEHQFFFWIAAQDVAVIHVPIVPMRLGDIYVTITASTLLGKDTVTRKLHVEADGLPQYRHQSILLDLSNRAYVFQYLHVNVTETPLITYDEDRYYVYGSNRAFVSVVGDVVGPIFPTMPVNATSLLHLPMDSAEQNMFNFAALYYTTMYMRLINQRNKTLERQSFHHMNIGYQRQLSFMAPDGSFKLFRSDWNQSSSSVWLTAYCARVLQEASFYEWENFIYIDPEVISKAVRWVLKHQTVNGSFYEVTWLPDRKVNSSLNWGVNDSVGQRNISLTAHVLITLEMVKDLPGGLGSQVALAQGRAMRWLERNLNLLEEKGNAYEVALVAYALMLSRSSAKETAFRILAKHARQEGGLMYWGIEAVPLPPYKLENQKPFALPRLPYKYDSSNIEATSYALLTYVARQEFMIDPIVKWLNSQRLTDGGWASTQDSAIAMKALSEYTVRSRLRDVLSLTVTVEATALPGVIKTLHVTDNNLAQLQKIEIPEAWGTVKVQAKGAGYAILQMSVQYNVDIARFQTQPPVPAFTLSTRANFHGRNQSHITYRSCASWTNLEESERSGLAVLDVAIPTGYIIQQQDLDSYVLSQRVPKLQRARYNPKKVVFYFEYLDKYDTCINFTIERWHPVANMSRYLPIRVYDYYAPERFNETIFDSLPTYLLNICEVCGSSQCPYCPIYNGAVPSPRIIKQKSIYVMIFSLSITFFWRSLHLFIL